MMLIMPKILLYGSWLVAVSAVGLLSQYFGNTTNQFFGIADDQEQAVRFEAPVEILTIPTAGQAMLAGEMVLQVHQSGLKADLMVVRERIQALKLADQEARASMESEVVALSADLRAEMARLENKILELQAREDVQRAFVGHSERGKRGQSVIVAEIESLKLRKRALTAATTAKVDDLQARLAATDRPFDAQIAQLQERHDELLHQQDQLIVKAQFEGKVGSVMFKPGDVVPPYQPILTLHGNRPTFVKAYIHESVFNDIRLNQTVWIRSSTTRNGQVWHQGMIKSLGSRIVEFPPRLLVNKMAEAWGREVVIQLDPSHDLLLGEKVNIQIKQPASLVSRLRELGKATLRWG